MLGDVLNCGNVYGVSNTDLNEIRTSIRKENLFSVFITSTGEFKNERHITLREATKEIRILASHNTTVYMC